MTRRPRVAVVGGGIGGLTAARELAKTGLCEPALFDAADRLGGVIGSERVDGFLHERAANAFRDDVRDGALALAEELGVAVERARPGAGKRWVWIDGKLKRVPAGPLAAITTDLLSIRGKLRVLAEPFRGRSHAGDESIAAFARRRLGPEVVRAAVGPLVAGVFAGDPDRLSLRAAFPALAELADDGGLMRGALRVARERRRRGERLQPPALYAPVGGFGRLVEALAADLGAPVATGATVRKVERLKNGRLRLRGDKLGRAAAHPFDAIVVAVDAPSAASILSGVAPDAARALREIEYAPVAVTYLGFRRDDVPHPLDGYGFLVADGEAVRSLGCVFESELWSGRAPPDHVLLRCVHGGVRDPGAFALDDAELLGVARRDLQRALGVEAEPVHHRVMRHRRAIAQYEVGHTDRVRAAERACDPLNVALAGAGYRGISVNDCVADARRVARSVIGRLGALALLGMALVGCSGGGGSSATGRETVAAARGDAGDAGQVAAVEAPAEPAATAGELVVQVVWPRPAAELLRSPGRNACGAERPAPLPVAPDAVIADRYATERMVGVAGAVVSIEGISAEAAPDVRDAAPAELALRECVFRPAVVRVAGPGAALALINDDERRHEVRLEHLGDARGDVADPLASFALPVIGHRVEIPIERPGIVRIATAADPDDVAYAVVPAHPYVAVTGSGGRARFAALPPGEYRVEVWYPPTAAGARPTVGDAKAKVIGGKTARARVALGR